MEVQYRICESVNFNSFQWRSKSELSQSVPSTIPLPSKAFDHIEWKTEDQENKYASSNLNDVQIDEFLDKIIKEMEDASPYLNRDLTLKSFSEEIDIHPHHVSRVINEKLGLNFSNFINSYRVEYSKGLLVQDMLSKYTISGIGNEAGFNSRSAFYNSFKKFTGISPGDHVMKKQAQTSYLYTPLLENTGSRALAS